MSLAAKRRAGRPTRDGTRRKSEELLEAATALFIERGFEGTTMEAIALAANMGKQAVYMRFPDKASVFMAVVQRLKEMGDAAQPEFDDSLPLREALPLCIHTMLTATMEPIPRLTSQLTLREGHRFPVLVKFLSDALVEQFIRPLALCIDKATAQGEARSVDSLTVASKCADLILAEVTRAVFRQAPLPPDEIARRTDEISDLVLNGLLKHN